MKKLIIALILLGMTTNSFCPPPKYTAGRRITAAAAASEAGKTDSQPIKFDSTKSNLIKRRLVTNKKLLKGYLKDRPLLPADHPARVAARTGTLREVNTWIDFFIKEIKRAQQEIEAGIAGLSL